MWTVLVGQIHGMPGGSRFRVEVGRLPSLNLSIAGPSEAPAAYAAHTHPCSTILVDRGPHPNLESDLALFCEVTTEALGLT